jgi:hypothetical protein
MKTSVSRRSIFFCVLFIIVVFLVTFAWSSNSSNNAEKNQSLQIFLDQALTTPYVGQLLWGDAHVGTNNFTLWLKNNTPHTLEKLSLIPPLLPLNCTLTWNLQNYNLKPYETKKATLTLLIPPSCNIEDTIRFGGSFNILYFVEE